jgi:2-keto-3-deoxy-L-rhamnonate aldolase RhmA
MFGDAIGLKRKIQQGQHVFGVSVPVDCPRERFEAILRQGPYDFVSIDSQHTAFNEERVEKFCAMAEELDVFVQFRIKHTRHAYLVGNYVDLGPCGVEVPQTEHESTAEEALHYFYYPPAGGRSYGGRARRAAQGKDPVAYADWWNRFGVLWLQIESVEAVTHSRQLALPGVDCLSFGPIDLTFSLKAHPRHPFQTVDDCVRYVAQALEGTTTRVCVRNGTRETREQYAAMGATVFLESPRSAA